MTTSLKTCLSIATAAATAAFAASNAVAEDESPKTSWGVPDLTGTWDFATITPFNRPQRFEGREYLTEEEYNGWNEGDRRRREASERAPSRPAPDNPSQGDVDVGYNSFFIDSGKHLSPGRRTSIVVDPPNGRTPGNTMAARMRYAEMRERWERPPRTPADRPPATRCLIGFNSGPPMSSGAYNNLVRIFQSPGYVGILNEMVNDHRVIATDGGEHMSNVRFWKGDSRGRWEGDTFVVETKSFRPETNFRGSGPNMHLTERFTRIDENTLRYEYTVDDPEMFQGPWSTEQDWVRTDSDIYEYACHEGNRSLLMQMRAAKQQYDAGNAVPDETWLPTWYKWMPRKADLLRQAGKE